MSTYCVSVMCSDLAGHCEEDMTHGIMVTSCVCDRSMRMYYGNDCEQQLVSDVVYYVGLVLLGLSSLVSIPAIVFAYAHHLPFEASIFLASAVVGFQYNFCVGDDSLCFFFYHKSWFVANFVLIYASAFVLCVYLSDIAPAQRGKWHVLLLVLSILCVTDNPISLSNFIFALCVSACVLVVGSVLKTSNEPKKRVIWRTGFCVMVYPQVKAVPFMCALACMLMGTVLYTVAETHSNYPYVHAIYQTCVFLSIFLFLVSKENRAREDMAARRSKSLLYRLYGDANLYSEEDYLTYEDSPKKTVVINSEEQSVTPQ